MDPDAEKNKEQGSSQVTENPPALIVVEELPKIDHNHPLYLHPSYSAGLSLVSEKLTSSEDYAFWSKAMRICLISKNKLDFVTGACKKEDFSPNLHHLWDRCNALVLAWIMNSVSRELMSGNIYTESAFSVWNDLKERLHKVNGSRIFQLHRDICLAQQGVDYISTYFAKLRTMWEEFDAICNLPNCGCPLFQKHITHASNLKFFQLLNGLNDSYSNVRTNLVMREILPSVSQAYDVLVQEEHQRTITGNSYANHVTDVKSSAASTNKPRGQKRNLNLLCDYCKTKGHDADHCFKKNGYPPGWKFRNNQGQGRTPQANTAIDKSSEGFAGAGSEVGGAAGSTPLKLPRNQPMMVTAEQLEHLARSMAKSNQAASEAGEARVNIASSGSGPLQWNGVGDWA